MKRKKENDTKGLPSSRDGQAQGKLETYGGEQYLEAEHDTNLHYFVEIWQQEYSNLICP